MPITPTTRNGVPGYLISVIERGTELPYRWFPTLDAAERCVTTMLWYRRRTDTTTITI